MIRTYRPGDEEQINALYKTVFGKERSKQEWQWKFTVLSKQPPVIIVAEQDGIIVGHAACLKITGSHNGKTVLFGERVDVMVHPNFQGQGIYRNIIKAMLEECAKQEIDILYGFPAQTAKQAFLSGASGSDLGNVPRFMAIQKLGTLLSAKFPVLSPVRKIPDGLYSMVVPKKSRYRIRPLEARDNRLIDELYERHADSYPLHAVRDYAYVDRRFLQHPEKAYKVLLLEANEQVEGYAVVLEEDKSGIRIASIIDLWCANNAETLKEMLKAIRAYTDAAAINMWAVPGSPRFKALKKAGFLHLNSPMPFVIKAFNKDLNASQMTGWHLSQSDVDSY